MWTARLGKQNGAAKPPGIKRSSTNRSIDRRSSFMTEDDEEEHSNGDFGTIPNGEDDEERSRRRSEADEHVANYVSTSLKRVGTNESLAVFEDEFEAQLDN